MLYKRLTQIMLEKKGWKVIFIKQHTDFEEESLGRVRCIISVYICHQRRTQKAHENHLGIKKEREEREERGQKDQLKHPLRPTYNVKDREKEPRFRKMFVWLRGLKKRISK